MTREPGGRMAASTGASASTLFEESTGVQNGEHVRSPHPG